MPSGRGRPRRRCAATSVLRNSTALVIGPTPPGPGVIAPTRPIASPKSTPPTTLVLPGLAPAKPFIPPSITTAPSFPHLPLHISGPPPPAPTIAPPPPPTHHPPPR